MLFRSARNSDLDAIYHLAQQSGVGMTTLPKDKKLLKKRLSWSTESYKKKVHQPTNEYYLFVLEDHNTKQIVGTSAIEAKTGHNAPFYSYKISPHTNVCPSLKIQNNYVVLSLVNDNAGYSEICTLFLEPNYRKNNNGLLLSKARFLFMAQHPFRFTPIVIAEMRGVFDENGHSPFWNNIGAHFFPMTFIEADLLNLSTNKEFIADFMPKHPIYVELLSPEAQAVIGRPHQSTIPAMNILLKEGFHFNNHVDIFDGGPTIESPLNNIKTVALSRVVTIKEINDERTGDKFLLSNTQMDFRATKTRIQINELDHTCMISKKTADLLEVKCGDNLRIAPTRIEE
jgi:arginine N-succinyltransferase